MEYAILGAKGGGIGDIDAFLEKLSSFSRAKGVEAQAMNAACIFGSVHLISAAEHTIRAFDRGSNSLSSLTTEVLLYAAGQRQISKAIQLMGVKDETEAVAFIIFGAGALSLNDAANSIPAHFGIVRDDSVLDAAGKDGSAFGTDAEGRAAEDAVLEKIALLDISK
jgi:KEOPS complex subunit Cgi121